MKLTPLSAWGKGDYVPPKHEVDPAIDMKADPPKVVDGMDARPSSAASPISSKRIHRTRSTIRLFIVSNGSASRSARASISRLRRADIRQAFERGYGDGKALVLAEAKKAAGIGEKGWVYTTRSGAYGTDYLYRAAIAQCCVGENLPQDAVYPALSSDSEGHPLDGSSSYVLHFEKGKLPPVDGFWSVTAYDIDGYFHPERLEASGDRRPRQAGRQCEWLGRSLHPGGLAGEREGAELAPRPRRRSPC